MTDTHGFSLWIFVIGLICGSSCIFIYHRIKHGTYKKLRLSILQSAERDAEQLKANAEFERKQKFLDHLKQLEEEAQAERRKIQKEENRLIQKEDKIEAKMNVLEKKLSQAEKQEAKLHSELTKFDEMQKAFKIEEAALRKRLEETARLSSSEAKQFLLNELEKEVEIESAHFIRKRKKEAEESAEREVQRILATAINRLAVPCVSESSVNVVNLPNDEMKGRIIGKEGRNIRTLERATGVTFIIDDTPGAIVLSAFDPIRLGVAKQALTELITDGRIHPTRIEEAVEKAKNSVEKKIKEYGEDAAFRTGQTGLHPEIIQLLGKLKFRYSFGQNILEHSLEVSHLMGIIAAELHLDVHLAKRIGLLHDVGKAVSHEIQGTHAMIGHDLALKYGETQEVAIGIGCHHNEMEPSTIEASFCGAADAISASRPGARIEAVSEYIKRIQRLEQMAREFPGVDRAYAMQAGRELCIVVLPDMLDDAGSAALAKNLTKRIEKELHYTGKIKVTVIREKRAVAYAL